MREFDPNCCKKMIPRELGDRKWESQCHQKVIKDGFCLIHHPDYPFVLSDNEILQRALSKVKERCKGKTVYNHECTRGAIKDGYCKQHHPDTLAAMRQKSFEIYKARQARNDNSKNSLLLRAKARIEDLEKEVEELKAELEYLKGLSQERGEQS